MATVEAHQASTTLAQVLLDRRIRYQKHKPGKNLSLERLPADFFRVDSIHQFGDRVVLNDGVVVMEIAPAVLMRRGRVALLLPTGEELFFFVE